MMDRLTTEQLDRQLGEWLRDESRVQAPVELVEGVFARTERTRQGRRWTVTWRPGRPADAAGDRSRMSLPAFGLAGTVAVVLLVVVGGVMLRPRATAPGTIPTPTPSPSPTATAPGSSGPPVPVPTTLGTSSATSLFLGNGSSPIAVTAAFDSIWVANLDASEVRRYDPDTMAEQARIPVQGAAWFAEADGALWATHQGGLGMARIDPATNTVVAEVGEDSPCGAPVVAFERLWQSACDAGVVMRIDPSRNVVEARIPAAGYGSLVLAGDRLVAAGPDGLASLDPATSSFSPVPYPGAVGARFIASDGATVWVMGATQLARVDPATGRTTATFDYPGARGIAFGDASGWLTSAGDGLVEIDLATNQVRRVIPVPGGPVVPLVAAGRIWVTDFNSHVLWRIDP